MYFLTYDDPEVCFIIDQNEFITENIFFPAMLDAFSNTRTMPEIRVVFPLKL